MRVRLSGRALVEFLCVYVAAIGLMIAAIAISSLIIPTPRGPEKPDFIFFLAYLPIQLAVTSVVLVWLSSSFRGIRYSLLGAFSIRALGVILGSYYALIAFLGAYYYFAPDNFAEPRFREFGHAANAMMIPFPLLAIVGLMLARGRFINGSGEK